MNHVGNFDLVFRIGSVVRFSFRVVAGRRQVSERSQFFLGCWIQRQLGRFVLVDRLLAQSLQLAC